MNKELRIYVEDLFRSAPQNRKTYELKEEIFANINDQYNDLIASGYDKTTAYQKAINSIGDVNELLKGNELFMDKQNKYIKNHHFRRTIAIMIYILSLVPPIINEGIYGSTLFVIMVAVATGLITYRGDVEMKEYKIDDDLYAEFLEYKYSTSDDRRIKGRISSLVWSLILAVYMIVSFLFDAWEVSWVIFLIGGFINSLIFFIMDLTKDKSKC